MILAITDFEKYQKVKFEILKAESYFLGLGDNEYFKMVRNLNIPTDELPIEADVLQEIKDVLILAVSIQVCSGLIGQNAQAISEGIVIDPWKELLDTYTKQKEIDYALIGKNHFIDGSTEFDSYTARMN